MAGPWFVDPQNGLTTNDGLSADTPWQLIPGQTGATAQTGYGVVAGDTINVRNGSTSSLRIVPPVNSLTYRGYGLADNVLILTLPAADVTKTRQVRVVREVGVHEGMWTIDGRANDEDGSCVNTSTRTNTVFEDIQMLGYMSNNRPCVVTSSNAAKPAGLTFRRFELSGAGQRGIESAALNLLIEWGRVQYTTRSLLGPRSNTTIDHRLGSTDVFRYLDLRYPGKAGPDATADTEGDFFIMVTADTSTYRGTLTIHDIYGYKDRSIKSGLVLKDGINGINISRCHFAGAENASMQMLIVHARGAWTYRDMYFHNWGDNGNPLFIAMPDDAGSQTYGIDTGASITVENVLALGNAAPGLYQQVPTIAQTFDGSVRFNGVTLIGTNDHSQTYGAVVMGNGSNATISANFLLTIENCALDNPGRRVFDVQTGFGNSAQFVFRNNTVPTGASRIGATTYADLAAFEAAHSYATGNTEADPLITEAGRPLPNSPLLTGGTSTIRRDINGVQGRNFIGAYAAAAMRQL